jgi:hypothetical protein
MNPPSPVVPYQNKILYRVDRIDEVGYDEYEYCVVVAATPAQAKQFGPYDLPLAIPSALTVTKLGVVTSDVYDNFKIGDVVAASYIGG